MVQRPRVILAAVLGLCACTTRLYPGPERPPEDVARLALVRSNPNMTFKDAALDGTSIADTAYGFSSDYEIAPGPHTISFRVVYGADAYCDAREHLCPASVVAAYCSGTFVAEPGVSYAVELESEHGEVQGLVRIARRLANAFQRLPALDAPIACQQDAQIEMMTTENGPQF